MKNKKTFSRMILLCLTAGFSSQASNNQFEKLIKNGDLQGLQSLLSKNPNFNINNPNEPSLLCCATKNGKIKITKWLLEKGADVNLQNPLEIAVKYGRMKHIKEFVKKNANIKNIGTGLITAIKAGNYHIAKFLIENGADIDVRMDEDDSTGLIWALRKMVKPELRKKYFKLANLLIKKGANIKTIEYSVSKNTIGWALEGYCDSEDKCFSDIIKLLVLKGESIDVCDYKKLSLKARNQLFESLLPFSIEDVENEYTSIKHAKIFFNFATQELAEQFFNEAYPLTFHTTTSQLPKSKLLTGGQEKMMTIIEKYYQVFFRNPVLATSDFFSRNDLHILLKKYVQLMENQCWKFKKHFFEKKYSLPTPDQLFPIADANGIEIHKKLTEFINDGMTIAECKYLCKLGLFAQTAWHRYFKQKNQSTYKKFQDLQFKFNQPCSNVTFEEIPNLVK